MTTDTSMPSDRQRFIDAVLAERYALANPDRVAECEIIMPDAVCASLGLHHNATYAQGAAKLRQVR
ncbi:hypothetical protein [Acidisphaera sp. L21]|uniref:hypothetical protein n=1 Tax=Acidisphaera sp. L21 TaxID=1641851 RepID=UPI00131CA84A|nr:hypothetical protein [Acidisphaera sp. L21]